MQTQKQKICRNSSSLDNSSGTRFSRALRNKTLITTTALFTFLASWLGFPGIQTKTEQTIKNPTPVVELNKQHAVNKTHKPASLKITFTTPAYAAGNYGSNIASLYIRAAQHLSETEIIEIIQPILNSRSPSGKRPVLEKEIQASKEILQQGLELEQIVKEMQQPVEKTLKHSDITYKINNIIIMITSHLRELS